MVSNELYNCVIDNWEKTFQHPFIQEIASGVLPIEKFKYYMVQDHKYLLEYAKIFAMGIVKSEKEKDIRDFSKLITASIDTENAVHQNYLKRLKITSDLIEHTPTHDITKKYTGYMLSVAKTGGLKEIITAALSCSWSYLCMGKYLYGSKECRNHPFYGEWVMMYASKEYEESNQLMIHMVNEYSDGCSGEEVENLKKIMMQCSSYEQKFWNVMYREEEK